MDGSLNKRGQFLENHKPSVWLCLQLRLDKMVGQWLDLLLETLGTAEAKPFGSGNGQNLWEIAWMVESVQEIGSLLEAPRAELNFVRSEFYMHLEPDLGSENQGSAEVVEQMGRNYFAARNSRRVFENLTRPRLVSKVRLIQ